MSQEETYKAMSETEWMTSTEIAIEANISLKRVVYALRRLIKYGEAEQKYVSGEGHRYFYRKLPMQSL